MQVECKHCGKEFKTSASRVKRGRGVYCGKPCLYGARKHSIPWNFKGDKHTPSNGYVYVYSPDHPQVQGKGYKRVLEHRLVMEQHLGRLLVPGETVHHKHANKQDNSIENLELWFKPQPNGARVSDLIEFIGEHHRPAMEAWLQAH